MRCARRRSRASSRHRNSGVGDRVGFAGARLVAELRRAVAIPALVLATRRFASFGHVDGRQLRAEITLAVANAGFILLMLSGMVIPVSKLPGAMRTVSEALPSEALSHMHAVGTGTWVVLAVCAVVRQVYWPQVLPLGVIPRRRPRRAGRRSGTCRPSCLQLRPWRSLAPSLRASRSAW